MSWILKNSKLNLIVRITEGNFIHSAGAFEKTQNRADEWRASGRKDWPRIHFMILYFPFFFIYISSNCTREREPWNAVNIHWDTKSCNNMLELEAGSQLVELFNKKKKKKEKREKKTHELIRTASYIFSTFRQGSPLLARSRNRAAIRAKLLWLVWAPLCFSWCFSIRLGSARHTTNAEKKQKKHSTSKRKKKIKRVGS